MKKGTIEFGILFWGLLSFVFTFFAQDHQYEAIAVNIEVPVRVFQGDRFVDNLTMDDFEVFEEGVLQRIEAVYLIKATGIEREQTQAPKEELSKKFAPELNRHFVLIFEINNILPELEEAIRYFMEKVIVPGDKLTVVTPIKTYHFKEDSWEFVPRLGMADQLTRLLRKDIFTRYQVWQAPANYPIEDAEGDILREIRYNFIGKRYVDEDRLMEVAESLKKMPGQKNVFFFLQQELIDYAMPETSSEVSGIFASFEYLDTMSTVAAYHSITPGKIKRAFADSSILFQFLYIKDKQYFRMDAFTPFIPAFDRMDTTSGMFITFKDISEATGGMAHVTINTAATFKRAVEASENYYLLYYSPSNYKADGKFKNIKVKVKNLKCQVIHRAGYIAD